MKIALGAVNVRIHCNVGFNISGFEVLRIKYKKSDSDQTTGYWAGTLGTVDKTFNDGTTFKANEYFYYNTQDNDIDVLGEWSVQGYVQKIGGLDTHGDDDEGYDAWSTLSVRNHL
jgi:hypothetical protein